MYLHGEDLLVTQLQGQELLVACTSQEEIVAIEWELWGEGDPYELLPHLAEEKKRSW